MWPRLPRQVLKRTLWILAVLATSGTASILAQPPGGLLVQHEVLNRMLEAQVEVQLYEEPERVPFVPFLWQEPDPIDRRIATGDQVEVIRIKESSMGVRRFVWLEVKRADPPAPREIGQSVAQENSGEGDADDEASIGWIRLGARHAAIARVAEQFRHVEEREPDR